MVPGICCTLTGKVRGSGQCNSSEGLVDAYTYTYSEATVRGVAQGLSTYARFLL